MLSLPRHFESFTSQCLYPVSHGGLSIYTSDKYNYIQRYDFSLLGESIVAISMEITNDTGNVIIRENLMMLIELVSREKKVFCGDFNLKADDENLIQDFISLFHTQFFFNVISKATRATDKPCMDKQCNVMQRQPGVL